MNRLNALVVAALTLGVFACDRNADKASDTNITSASPPPADTTTTPVAPVDPSKGDDLKLAPQQRGDAGTKDGGARTGINTTTGTSTGTRTDGTMTPNGGTMAAPDDTTNVAPGHIMFPPEKRVPGTGRPESNGSHDMGSGAPAGKH